MLIDPKFGPQPDWSASLTFNAVGPVFTQTNGRDCSVVRQAAGHYTATLGAGGCSKSGRFVTLDSDTPVFWKIVDTANVTKDIFFSSDQAGANPVDPTSWTISIHRYVGVGT
jgi:hypothetical protein